MFSGYWKNGLKNGKVEFKNLINGKASFIKGYCKDGEFAGTKQPDDEYRITNLSGTENYSIKKVESKENVIQI